jgi:hypothetical protein
MADYHYTGNVTIKPEARLLSSPGVVQGTGQAVLVICSSCGQCLAPV